MTESKVRVKYHSLNKEFRNFSEAILYLDTHQLNMYDKLCMFYPFNKKENCFDMKNPIHIFPMAQTKMPFFSPYLSKQDYFNTDPITFTEDTIRYLDDIDDITYFHQNDETDEEDFEINQNLVDFN